VWALVFYCLRCGDRDCALATISRAQSCVEFCGYLREYVQSQDLRLSHSSETRLRLLYKRAVRTSTDPYKRAVFCLVGRCDVADSHPDVCSKTEDYMWFKLCQVSCEDPDSGHAPSGDDLTLSQLQATLLEEFGETYFNASQVPMLYVTVLLLSQQFEAVSSSSLRLFIFIDCQCILCRRLSFCLESSISSRTLSTLPLDCRSWACFALRNPPGVD
jgi:nuclear pore complex protein Nup93